MWRKPVTVQYIWIKASQVAVLSITKGVAMQAWLTLGVEDMVVCMKSLCTTQLSLKVARLPK